MESIPLRNWLVNRKQRNEMLAGRALQSREGSLIWVLRIGDNGAYWMVTGRSWRGGEVSNAGVSGRTESKDPGNAKGMGPKEARMGKPQVYR